jgi:hypothetical protein
MMHGTVIVTARKKGAIRVSYGNNTMSAVSAMESQRLGGMFLDSEREFLCRCECCKDKIYPGDDHLRCDNGNYCRDCVMMMSPDELMDVLGYSFEKRY